jgi:hypothetical protein
VIAVVMPNEPSVKEKPWTSYRASVDDVEHKSGGPQVLAIGHLAYRTLVRSSVSTGGGEDQAGASCRWARAAYRVRASSPRDAASKATVLRQPPGEENDGLEPYGVNRALLSREAPRHRGFVFQEEEGELESQRSRAAPLSKRARTPSGLPTAPRPRRVPLPCCRRDDRGRRRAGVRGRASELPDHPHRPVPFEIR